MTTSSETEDDGNSSTQRQYVKWMDRSLTSDGTISKSGNGIVNVKSGVNATDRSKDVSSSASITSMRSNHVSSEGEYTDSSWRLDRQTPLSWNETSDENVMQSTLPPNPEMAVSSVMGYGSSTGTDASSQVEDFADLFLKLDRKKSLLNDGTRSRDDKPMDESGEDVDESVATYSRQVLQVLDDALDQFGAEVEREERNNTSLYNNDEDGDENGLDNTGLFQRNDENQEYSEILGTPLPTFQYPNRYREGATDATAPVYPGNRATPIIDDSSISTFENNMQYNYQGSSSESRPQFIAPQSLSFGQSPILRLRERSSAFSHIDDSIGKNKSPVKNVIESKLSEKSAAVLSQLTFNEAHDDHAYDVLIKAMDGFNYQSHLELIGSLRICLVMVTIMCLTDPSDELYMMKFLGSFLLCLLSIAASDLRKAKPTNYSFQNIPTFYFGELFLSRKTALLAIYAFGWMELCDNVGLRIIEELGRFNIDTTEFRLAFPQSVVAQRAIILVFLICYLRLASMKSDIRVFA